MTVKRSRGRWVVDVWLPGPDGRKHRVREVSPIQTERAAKDHERHLITKAHYEPSSTSPAAPFLADFAIEFLKTHVRMHNKPGEFDNKKSALRHHILPWFGGMRLDEISALEIEKWRADRLEGDATSGRKPLGKKTMNNYTGMLLKILRTAVDWGVSSAAVPKIPKLATPIPVPKFLSVDDARKLVDETTDLRWRSLFVVALRAGLRTGELTALRWQDVDLVRAQLDVSRSVTRGRVGTPKSGKGRHVALSVEAVETLRAWKQLSTGELVWPAAGGGFLTKSMIRNALWAACRRAGLPLLRAHALRHTFASHVVMAGHPLKVVQELLGHATIDMSLRYSHLSPHVARDAVASLDSTLVGGTKRSQAKREAAMLAQLQSLSAPAPGLEKGSPRNRAGKQGVAAVQGGPKGPKKATRRPCAWHQTGTPVAAVRLATAGRGGGR